MNQMNASLKIPIISVIGKKNSGKTTLVEGILPQMIKMKWIVCTIKHHSHGDFELDTKGKDTYRHYLAGAKGVLIASPTRIAYFERSENELPSLPYLLRFFPPETNLILTEGFHRSNFPRIEICRREISTELLSDKFNPLIAVVADFEPVVSVPCFPLNAYTEIAIFLNEFLHSKYALVMNRNS